MDIVEFSDKDYLMNPDDKTQQMKYRTRTAQEKTSIAWGQRKLFISELQFLTRFWDKNKYPTIRIIYAGSAPGKHIKFLAQLFPGTYWELYDPREFDIKENDQIKIHQQFFLDETAEYWAKRAKKENLNLFFISDIRTADYEKYGVTREENEADVLRDMEWQQNWYYIMKPIYAHLKFRCLYYEDDKPAPPMLYMDGYVFRQPWALQGSSESRLVPYGVGIMRQWQPKEYENSFFYHNLVNRQQKKYRNVINGKDDLLDGLELSNDYDSTCEAMIWKDYLKRIGGELYATEENVKALANMLGDYINEGKVQGSKYYLRDLRRDPLVIKRYWADKAKKRRERYDELLKKGMNPKDIERKINEEQKKEGISNSDFDFGN
jgi:hypothetical protein